MADKTKTKPTRSEKIAADIEALRLEHEAAQAELYRLQATRPGMLLDASDDELAAHDGKMAKATRRIERATAMQGKLGPELVAAQADDDQTEREIAYAAAEAAATEYRRFVTKEYPAAARKLVALLEQMSDLHTKAIAANESLPMDREAIHPNAFRQEPPPAKEPPEYEERVYWLGPDGCRYQAGPATINGKAPYGWTRKTEKVRKIKITGAYIPRPYITAIELAVFLPGVEHDDVSIWGSDR